jgi:hypothetical protein
VSTGTSVGAVSGESSGTSLVGISGTAGGAVATGSTRGPSPCGTGASTVPVSFSNQIMPILQRSCSAGGGGLGPDCHGDPSIAMALAAGGTRQWFGPPPPAVDSASTLAMIYNGFVCQPQGTCTAQVSNEDPYMDVVKPGDPTQSFLWYKINGTQRSLDMETPDQCDQGDLGNCGGPMPFSVVGLPMAMLLPQARLDVICNWIEQGALNDVSPCPDGQGEQSGICATCPSDKMLCNGYCSDGQTDVYNCGGCATVCPPGATCHNGTCACPGGGTVCGDVTAAGPVQPVCANKQTDPNNCGGCGIACATGATCQSGTCICSVAGSTASNGVCCPSGETGCNGTCADLQNDPNNCGACSYFCADMMPSCRAAECSSCPEGKTACNDACVDEQTDPSNCGACGNECAADAAAPFCRTGTCSPN